MTDDPRRTNPQGTPEQQMDAATGNASRVREDEWPATAEELGAAALHRAGAEWSAMPAQLRVRIAETIEAGAIAGSSLGSSSGVGDGVGRSERETLAFAASEEQGMGVRQSGNRWVPWAIAMAALIALAVTVVISQQALSQRNRALEEARVQLAAMESQVRENATLLATAREEAAKQGEAARIAMNREIELAQRLADATAARATMDGKLRDAEVKIAALEAPVDPATLRQTRTKLLEVPGTIRMAWSPFNLEGAAPAEQPNIQGDVVWNDELQTGYLRFVGLKANDPKVEQYQVWVIDERGMEQKVSGGVFNATAQGEVIVPITPGIDVGRVALFAVTVEKPGGTWVPDLKRRVVVAPRPS